MKAYINEVHTTLTQTIQLILFNYQAALGNYVTGYLKDVDSDENFKLIEEDFDAHEHNLIISFPSFSCGIFFNKLLYFATVTVGLSTSCKFESISYNINYD